MAQSFFHRLAARVHSPGWGNPLFQDPEKTARRHIRSRLVLLTAVIALSFTTLGLLGLRFAISDAHLLGGVHIEGARPRSSARIAKTAWEVVSSCSILGIPCVYTWNVGDASWIEQALYAHHEQIFADQPEVALVDHDVRIAIRERFEFFAISYRDTLWLVDESGIVVRQATDEDRSPNGDLPEDGVRTIVVDGRVRQDFFEGRSLVEIIPELHETQRCEDALREYGVQAEGFVLTNDPGKAGALYDGDKMIWFSPWGGIGQGQCRRAAEMIKKNLPITSSIDVRFSGRMYIK